METVKKIIKTEIALPENDEWRRIQRITYENLCRISVIKRLISDPSFSNDKAIGDLTKEYVDLATEREMLFLDYVRQYVPEGCISVVHWEFDGFNKLYICGEYEVDANGNNA